MPENTIPAFIKALDIGVTTIEMDVVITGDGEVLVSHEPFFNHEISTHPNGKSVTSSEEQSLNIYHLTVEEVQAYDVGTKPHSKFAQQSKFKVHKPLLKEVVDSVEHYTALHNLPMVHYNIEIKYTNETAGKYHPEAREFATMLNDVIIQKGITARCTVQSFAPICLDEMATVNPELKLVLLIENREDLEANLAMIHTKIYAYSPYYKLVDKGLVDKCHAKGIKIIPWTINNEEDIKYYIGLNIDGIISDYPDKVLEIYQNMRNDGQ